MNLIIRVGTTSASSLSYEILPKDPEKGSFYPVPLAPDQSWYWSSDWQAMEAAANADLEEGRYLDFDSVDDFIKYLDSNDE
jgi:hypothetical protein